MFGKDRHASDTVFFPRGREFSQKRINDVERQLDIVGTATAAGHKNEPHSDDRDINEDERRTHEVTIGFVNSMSRRAKSETTDRSNAIRALIPSEFDPAMERSNMRLRVMEVKDLQREEVERTYVDKQREHRTLRSQEEASGLAPYSAVYKNDYGMYMTVLFAMWMCESIFNAFSLEELQDRGLFGGLIMAISIGVANIMMGLGLGFFGWRLMIHRQPLVRMLGIVITILLIFAGLALHLALGDLREAISHNTKAQIDFLVVLKPWRWFAYTSIAPFILFAVGMGTFFIAALKGRGGTWGVVAPYWMHDYYDRRYRQAEKAHDDAKYNLRASIQNAYDSELAKLKARLESETANVAEIRRLVAEAQNIERILGDSIAEELDRLHIWLRSYRETNCAVRTTPPPAYFAVYPDFSALRIPRLDLSELLALAQTAEQALARNRTRLAEFQERTLDEQMAAIDALLTVISSSERRAAQQLIRDDQPTSIRA